MNLLQRVNQLPAELRDYIFWWLHRLRMNDIRPEIEMRTYEESFEQSFPHVFTRWEFGVGEPTHCVEQAPKGHWYISWKPDFIDPDLRGGTLYRINGNRVNRMKVTFIHDLFSGTYYAHASE